jgi:hypothetical protein
LHRNWKHWLVMVITPIVAGSTIYLFFRASSLRIFRWIELLPEEVSQLLSEIRIYFSDSELPNWIAFNLPDGLWQFALSNSVCIMWKGDKAMFWIFFPFLSSIGLGMEFLQCFGLISGTFDILDVAFNLAAVSLSFMYYKAMVLNS